MIREIGTPLIRKSIIGYVEYRLLENIFFIGYHESHLLGKGSCYNQDSLYPFTGVNWLLLVENYDLYTRILMLAHIVMLNKTKQFNLFYHNEDSYSSIFSIS
mgnify:CR=1 FL=1